MSNLFDIWFLKANTVYQRVPYGVATDWVEQGRLSGDDRVRPSGVETEWMKVIDHPLLRDFIHSPVPITSPGDAIELTDYDWAYPSTPTDDDDDVDMIPLIDISMVLLIFFMMTATVAAVSSVDLPAMKHAMDVTTDANSMTITIDRRFDGNTIYSLHIGNNLPELEDSNLTSKDDAISRLKTLLKRFPEPPEVRIACHQQLPRALVHDIARELQKLKDNRMIALYSAEVIEQQ